MPEQPTHLSLSGNTLRIAWSDGRELTYDVRELRAACPCAGCRADRSRLGIGEDDPVPADPDVAIGQMAPAGNYAYKIRFSDGHDTGLFTLDLLRRLGKEETPG